MLLKSDRTCSFLSLFIMFKVVIPAMTQLEIRLSIYVLGSLIKLVYFSRHEDKSVEDKRKRSLKQRFGISNGTWRSYPVLGGRLHFVKFETTKINDCLDFIKSKQLHCGGMPFSQVRRPFFNLFMRSLQKCCISNTRLHDCISLFPLDSGVAVVKFLLYTLATKIKFTYDAGMVARWPSDALSNENVVVKVTGF